MNLFMVVVQVLITTLAITQTSYSEANPALAVCNETEREALLSFKSGLDDPFNRLASWVGGGDCCSWAGVVCHNLTGRVLELHLGPTVAYPDDNNDYYYDYYFFSPTSQLGGKISNSLLNLRHLRYLDLSYNGFGGSQIPAFLGSMKSLTHLNLHEAGFTGMVPPQLGNLSNLLYLDIGGNVVSVENGHWLSQLSMLKQLHLSFIDLTEASNWVQQINELSSLKELHLQECGLRNVPRSSFINLTRLEILDFSDNRISSYSFLERFNSLVSLDISGNQIWGPLPSVLQNLTLLRDLDLADNYFNSSLPNWMNNLSRLKKLVLQYNNGLHGDLSDGIGNLTSLTHLDLSYSGLQLEVKGCQRTMCNLQWLDLSVSYQIPGLADLFRAFLRCSSSRLQHLSFYDSELSGPIPEFIGSLTSLKFLDLSRNQLSGTIPESVGHLVQLEHLDLRGNSLHGTIFEAFLGNLTRLEVLSASGNQIALRVGLDWIPPFQLKTLALSSWQLGPKFPQWIRSQHRLSYLEFAGTGIRGRVPTWFWDKKFSQFVHVDLSGNNLCGKIPGNVPSTVYYLDLSSNNFEGLLPSLSTGMNYFNVSYNSFSGPISQLLCHEKDVPKELYFMILGNNQLSGAIPDCWMSWPELRFVELQNNNLKGNIPESIGSSRYLFTLQLNDNSLSGAVPRLLLNNTYLVLLDLSENLLSGPISPFLCNGNNQSSWFSYLMLGNNRFSGDIPDCWQSLPGLALLELQENNLTGHLPDSIGLLSKLKKLHLQKNHLSGELPVSLRNCKELQFLDIGENKFGGSLPVWIGESFINASVIRLRSNNFEGIIPHQLCNLRHLRILDMANNNLSSHIPRCIKNFSRMANDSGTEEPMELSYLAGTTSTSMTSGGSREDTAYLVNKGTSREYTTNLRYMVEIDLSNNCLSGQIPEKITNLAGIKTLNLSRNMLSGRIPKNMGNMSVLESLDLSFNKLSGEIPQSMASMTELSFLNLSYNNLTGTIPTSTQFSTFDQSSFLGNNLSFPIPISSNRTRNGSALANHDHHGVEFNELYVSALVGFVIGLGIVVAPLLYSRSWRLFYFQNMSRILDRLWEVIVLPIRVRFRRQV